MDAENFIEILILLSGSLYHSVFNWISTSSIQIKFVADYRGRCICFRSRNAESSALPLGHLAENNPRGWPEWTRYEQRGNKRQDSSWFVRLHRRRMSQLVNDVLYSYGLIVIARALLMVAGIWTIMSRGFLVVTRRRTLNPTTARTRAQVESKVTSRGLGTRERNEAIRTRWQRVGWVTRD